MKPLHLFALLALAAPAAADTCLDIPECKENYPAYQQLYDVKYKTEHDEYSRFLERYNSFSKDRDYHFTGKEVWEAEPLSSDAWGRKWAEHWKDYKKGKTKGNPWQMEVEERTQDLDGYIAGFDAAGKLYDELMALRRGGPKTLQSMLDRRIEHAFPGEMGREKFKVGDVIYAYLGSDARDALTEKKAYLSALKDGKPTTPDQAKKFGDPKDYVVRGDFSKEKKEFKEQARHSVTGLASSMAAQLNQDRPAQVPGDSRFFLEAKKKGDGHGAGGGAAAPAVTPAQAAALELCPGPGDRKFRESLAATAFKDIAAVDEKGCYKEKTPALLAEFDRVSEDDDRLALLRGELTGRWVESTRAQRELMAAHSLRIAAMVKDDVRNRANGTPMNFRGLALDTERLPSGPRPMTEVKISEDAGDDDGAR